MSGALYKPLEAGENEEVNIEVRREGHDEVWSAGNMLKCLAMIWYVMQLDGEL